MKYTTFTVLISVGILHCTSAVLCINEIQLGSTSKQSKSKKNFSMSGYNSGAQSSMEAGAYWKAREILAERSTIQGNVEEVEKRYLCCGLFALLSLEKPLRFFRTTE